MRARESENREKHTNEHKIPFFFQHRVRLSSLRGRERATRSGEEKKLFSRSSSSSFFNIIFCFSLHQIQKINRRRQEDSFFRSLLETSNVLESFTENHTFNSFDCIVRVFSNMTGEVDGASKGLLGMYIDATERWRQ
jgi:hypothetical protein